MTLSVQITFVLFVQSMDIRILSVREGERGDARGVRGNIRVSVESCGLLMRESGGQKLKPQGIELGVAFVDGRIMLIVEEGWLMICIILKSKRIMMMMRTLSSWMLMNE